MRNLTSIITCSLLLAGCGSGGSDNTATGGGNPNPPVTPPPIATVVVPEQVLNSLLIDADGDGDNDLVLSAYSGNGYTASQLLLNDGSGKYTNKNNAFPNYSDGANSAIFQAAIDANNDNVLDIIALLLLDNYEHSRLQLYLGSTNGTYTAANNITDSSLNGWGEIRVADYDNDGKQDFMLTHNPSGTQCDLVAVENSMNYQLNNDCWGGKIFRNDGNGHFAPANITLSDTVLMNQTTQPTIRGADVQAPDYAVFDIQPYVTTWNLLIGDINGDLLVDIVQPTFGERAMPSYINQSTPGNLKFEVRYSDTHQHAGTGALLDANRDGFADFIGSEGIFSDSNTPGADDATGTVAIFVHLNNGSGQFSRHRADMFSGDAPRVQHAREWLVADFDKDGFDDLFIADHGRDFFPFPGFPNTLLMNTNNGLKNTTATALSKANSFSHGATVGDVNGDGYPDLYINNDLRLESTHSEAARKEKRLWLNNGNGTFTASTQDL